MEWFSATVLFRIESTTFSIPNCLRSLIIVRADSYEAAFQKAKNIAIDRSKNESIKESDNEYALKATAVRIESIDMLGEEIIDCEVWCEYITKSNDELVENWDISLVKQSI